MGSSTRSIPVKAKITVCNSYGGFPAGKGRYKMLSEAANAGGDDVMFPKSADAVEDDDMPIDLPGTEWRMTGTSVDVQRGRSILYVDSFGRVGEGDEVYMVNESEYAAGGGEITSFFAFEQQPLIDFCIEMGFDAEQIELDTTVKQTL